MNSMVSPEMSCFMRICFLVVLLVSALSYPSCRAKTAFSRDAIKAEVEGVLREQEEVYGVKTDEARKRLAATCTDSLVFVGGDDGGQAVSVDFYVHDLADGYTQRPVDRTFQIQENTVIVTALQQTYKMFGRDTIFFNARSTKVFVRQEGRWKMAYVSFAPRPIHYFPRRPVAPDILATYSGLYQNGPDGTDSVFVKGGRLFLGPSGGEGDELIPVNDSTFIGKGYFGKTVFSRDVAGKVICSYFEFPDGQRLVYPNLK